MIFYKSPQGFIGQKNQSIIIYFRVGRKKEKAHFGARKKKKTMATTEWLLVLSNAFFIIPSIKAYLLNRHTRSILYFLMIFASSFHHSCIGGINCVLPANFSRKLDFFFAQLLIPVTALYLIKFPQRLVKLERYIIWSFMVALLMVEYFLNEPFWMQLIVVGLSVLFLFVYWIIYGCYAQKEYREETGEASCNKGCAFPKYDWINLGLGLGLSAMATTLFATQERWPGGYDFVHAVWHSLAALGQYYILSSRDAAPAWAAMDARIIRHKLK